MEVESCRRHAILIKAAAHATAASLDSLICTRGGKVKEDRATVTVIRLHGASRAQNIEFYIVQISPRVKNKPL